MDQTVWVFLLPLTLWAQDVEIAVGKPGVVHVRASADPIFMPACRGITWSVFNPEINEFESTAPDSCGPTVTALKIGPDGKQFELDVPLGPLPETGFHIVQPTIYYALKCREELPFEVAGCESLRAKKGPQMVVRNRGSAVPIQAVTTD
jgi:hypothetical protein